MGESTNAVAVQTYRPGERKREIRDDYSNPFRPRARVSRSHQRFAFWLFVAINLGAIVYFVFLARR